MPKIVIRNDLIPPPLEASSTTVFTKADGVWVVLEDGTVYGPLGIGLGGPAGGSLTGAYPNPGIAAGAITVSNLANGSVTGPKIAAGAVSITHIDPSLIDPIAALPGLRTLGSGAQQAVAGNDAKLFNARVPTGSAAGVGSDLGGTYPSPTIAKLQGYPLDLTVAPLLNDILTWDGTKWIAQAGGGGGITQLTADVTAGPGSGSQAATVVQIQSRPVTATAPLLGDGLVWNGVAWAPTPVAGGSNNLVVSLPGAWLHGGLVVGDLVRATGVADTLALADKSSLVTAAPFAGIITAIPAVGTATVAYYGEVPAVGLTAGARYFLDAAGTMVTPAPAPVVGEISLYVGYAKSATVFFLDPGPVIQL